MVGSDAVIGLPDDASVLEHEMPSQVGTAFHYHEGVLFYRRIVLSVQLVIARIVCKLCRSFVRLVVRSSNIGM